MRSSSVSWPSRPSGSSQSNSADGLAFTGVSGRFSAACGMADSLGPVLAGAAQQSLPHYRRSGPWASPLILRLAALGRATPPASGVPHLQIQHVGIDQAFLEAQQPVSGEHLEFLEQEPERPRAA